MNPDDSLARFQMSSSNYPGRDNQQHQNNMMPSPRTSMANPPPLSQPRNMATLPQHSPHHQGHYMLYGPPLLMPQQQQQQQPQVPLAAPVPGSRKRRRSDEPDLMGPPPTQNMPPSAYQYPQSMMVAAPAEEVAAPKPKAKKTRVNIPWTPAEEQQLKRMRDLGNSWSEIAKEFPARTEGSVKKHWYKDMHYAEFGESESAALLAAIKDYEASKWKVIGQKLGKPAKACEQYAKEHFPNLK